jgi:hypothetical protein
MFKNGNLYGVFAVCAAFFCLAPTARATCSHWNVGGTFTVVQSNGYRPEFTLTQSGTQVTGSAKYNQGLADTNGTVTGTMTGSGFNVTVTWIGSHAVGIYSGAIDPRGHLSGASYDRVTPTSRASWSSSRTFGCQAAAAPQPSITLTSPSADVFVLAGTGFLAGRAVHVRAVDDSALERYVNTTANATGSFTNLALPGLCTNPGIRYLSANDGRPGANVTGTVWSDTLSAVCR